MSNLSDYDLGVTASTTDTEKGIRVRLRGGNNYDRDQELHSACAEISVDEATASGRRRGGPWELRPVEIMGRTCDGRKLDIF